MKKYFQELSGALIGGTTGWISSGFYDDWIRPILLSAICAAVAFFMTYLLKKATNSK